MSVNSKRVVAPAATGSDIVKTLDSSATPIDAELCAALIERRPADQREEREIAYTLGELGGAEACAFLSSRLEAERWLQGQHFEVHAGERQTVSLDD